jgi:glycosyltransferase involved in cell wall biosynthesis
VAFTGALDEAGVHRLLRESRVVVVPSIWYEVLGIVILEAFALGRPVVASAIGGIPEAVVHGQTGLLCRPRDADELADRIAALLSNPAWAVEMGEAGRRHAETAFSPARHLDQLVQVYKEAIAEVKG